MLDYFFLLCYNVITTKQKTRKEYIVKQLF